MAEDKLFSDRDLFEVTATALVTGAAAIAGSRLNLPPNEVAAMSVYTQVIGIGLGRGAYMYASRRLPDFVKGFQQAHDPDPAKAQEKAQQAAETHKDDEGYYDAMYRSFKMMMDAADQSVIPTLGYLAGVYTYGNKKPDAFFRGLGRLLCDLEHGELEQLRELILAACKADDGDGGTANLLIITLETGEDQVRIRKYPDEEIVGILPSAPRLFSLLKRESLASGQGAAKGFRQEMGDSLIRIQFEAARRIRETIAPQAMVIAPLRQP